jgi:hypothetical protein
MVPLPTQVCKTSFLNNGLAPDIIDLASASQKKPSTSNRSGASEQTENDNPGNDQDKPQVLPSSVNSSAIRSVSIRWKSIAMKVAAAPRGIERPI